MRSNRSLIFAVAVAISLLTPSAMAISETATSQEQLNKQQQEAQIYFFNIVLNEFGATTPDQAVVLWAKGDETRNGVYKYSVSSKELKQWLIKRWGAPEKSFWIIGGSSPWLTSFDIKTKTNISATEYQYVVQYNWATSAGQEPATIEQLSVVLINDRWCITKTEMLSGDRFY
jgi:hypothetical protein